MVKWAGTLSTTEPYNYLGVVKVRQGNENSERFIFTIVENGKPYDLRGYRVFFCTHFSPYVSVEKPAKIIDAVNGKIEFTMDDACMQEQGYQDGYFEIYNEDHFMATTQNFTYTIQTSIIKQLMDGESYIQRLEELLEKVDKVTDEIREELERQFDEMKDFFETNQAEFDAWFDSVKEILASVDPGGVLLNEVVDARYSRIYGNFDSVSKRIDHSERLTSNAIPTTRLCSIEHGLSCYPSIQAFYWKSGFGVNALGDENWVGDIPQSIECMLEYPDNCTIVVYIPQVFLLEDPEIRKINSGVYTVNSEQGTIEINLVGGLK